MVIDRHQRGLTIEPFETNGGVLRLLPGRIKRGRVASDDTQEVVSVFAADWVRDHRGVGQRDWGRITGRRPTFILASAEALVGVIRVVAAESGAPSGGIPLDHGTHF